MSLTSIHLRNFKCFERFTLETAPLTILTGYNATGKSSLYQGVLLLAQKCRHNPTTRDIPLNGELVELGSAADVMFDEAKERQIELTLTTGLETASWKLLPDPDNPRSLTIDGTLNPLQSAEHKEITNLISSVVFLSPMRGSIPKAFPVPYETTTHADVGVLGQFGPWWYAREVDEPVDPARCHPQEPATSLRRQVDAYMSELIPGAQATADEVPGVSLVRFGVRTQSTSSFRLPTNCGYGLTYAFPIVVALLLARKGQLLVIDSPEAHLHPSAQSRLGELFARVAAAGVQLFIETHSDHVLNGMRLGLKKRLLPPELVTLLFCSGKAITSHGVQRLEIDQNGTIANWPVGFFDQAESDLSELTGWK